MKVLILGGTSFFGKSIVQQFVKNGDNVTLFTRGKLIPDDLPKHTHIVGDRKNEKDLAKAAGQWDVVVDNIAYEANDVKTALKIFGNAKRYFLTSTVSVYRYAPGGLSGALLENTIDFEARPEAEDLANIHWKYAHGKKEAEKVLHTESKTPWTIFRPTVVYGPFDVLERGFWYLIRLIKGGPILLANGGMNQFRLTYSEDLARCYVAASREPKTIGKVYNIAQKEIITLKEFVEQSMKALGLNRELISVQPNKAIESPFEYLKNIVPDITQAEKDFHFSPVPLSKCIHDTALWFRDHWKGDEGKLLETREKELALARKL